ncbi:hypothetical protein KPL74_14565 [Bacillus sp. NP157]|nr:hypothetical protein KPL74_14565 [Bacillus sp. NP157]
MRSLVRSAVAFAVIALSLGFGPAFAAPHADGTSRLSSVPVDCRNPAECSVKGP